MANALKPMTLYSHGRETPNPMKIAILLEELGLTYEVKPLRSEELKVEPYVLLNPNGRTPTIEDPNTGMIVWETGAIIEYLVETYDKEDRISFATSEEKWQAKMWLYFQVSGQGPYYGQKGWFQVLHHEQLPSAIERYEKEIKRVTKVINDQMAKEETAYILGDQLSYIDLAFYPWQRLAEILTPEWDQSELPYYREWIRRMRGLESVQRAYNHPSLKRDSYDHPSIKKKE